MFSRFICFRIFITFQSQSLDVSAELRQYPRHPTVYSIQFLLSSQSICLLFLFAHFLTLLPSHLSIDFHRLRSISNFLHARRFPRNGSKLSLKSCSTSNHRTSTHKLVELNGKNHNLHSFVKLLLHQNEFEYKI